MKHLFPNWNLSASSRFLLGLLVSLTLTAQQQPFFGAPIAIPGQIQVEDFDLGGEGVAYHDSDPENTGGEYRSTGVDIESNSIGGHNVGWIVPGEWLEYTVEITANGQYEAELGVASPNSGILHLELDGTDVSGPVIIESTGGWQTWETLVVPEIPLSMGEYTLRLVFDEGAFNVDQMTFNGVLLSDPPEVFITAPEDNATYYHGDDILVIASATDPDGTIAMVEFYADDELIGMDNSPPYEWFWEQPEIGNYDLLALATDNDGVSAWSPKVDISVDFPEYPFEVNFSTTNAFQDQVFDLTLETTLGSAEIWYTLDGSDPLSSNSAITASAPTSLTIDPNDLSSGRGRTPGVVVRAVVMGNGLQQSRIATQTYLFINEVRNQSHPGGGWPEEYVNGQILEYDVNPEVVNDPVYSSLIETALLDIPSISLVFDLDSLFDAERGIYVNAEFHGREWERPVSVELLNPDGTPGFQIDAGARMRGGWSRHHNFPKHSFRLFFREDYGDRDLDFALFGDEGVDEFRKLDLRTSQNYAWSNGYIAENTMNRDVFSRDLQGRMGQPYTRSRYYHLYLNGLYWGLFQSQERPEAKFAESYFGGDDDDYDVVKVDVGEDWNLYEIEATDGNLDAWQAVWQACENGFTSLSDYYALESRHPDGSHDPAGQRLVDIDNLIDYMIIIFYTGNFDAPVSKFRGNQSPNNFYAINDRESNDGFIFLTHDSEHTLLVDPHPPGVGVVEDRVNINAPVYRFEEFHPQWLHTRLAENLEYRLRFADRVYKHFNNDGPIQPATLAEIFNHTAEMIDLAIIGESMRWGDLQRSKLLAWDPAIEAINNDYFPVRGNIVMDQFRSADLYPSLEPPLFKLDGVPILASTLLIQGATGVEVEFPPTNSGSIVYTLDGSDPRGIGGGFSGSAQFAGNHELITVTSTVQLKARLITNGEWSALHELTVYNQENLEHLTLSEVHYHPLDEGELSGRDFEFLELFNAGPYPVNLSLSGFINGVDYIFPDGSLLEPGEVFVIASDALSFHNRYGFLPQGEYAQQLDNGGERLVLITAVGDTILNVRYDDDPPWPLEPDGNGPSLTWTDETGSGDTNDGLNWSASIEIHGTPGQVTPVAIDPVDLAQPSYFQLSQNSPNPFNPSTRINYFLSIPSELTLNIFDLRGRLVRTLIEGEVSAGDHAIVWDGLDGRGQPTSAGMYFYRLSMETSRSQLTPGNTITRKMILLR